MWPKSRGGTRAEWGQAGHQGGPPLGDGGQPAPARMGAAPAGPCPLGVCEGATGEGVGVWWVDGN